MYAARILYPIEVLGPGKRVGIWLCGCPHRCEGCSNPELWEVDESRYISVSSLLGLIGKIVSENEVEGFTITGGEPFYQAEELSQLLKGISEWSKDILVYSGYTREQIESFSTLENIAVLIDGRYIRNRNRCLTLRGSDNQKIHILNKEFEEKYMTYLSSYKMCVQNFIDGQSVISVGIHRADLKYELQSRIKKYGIIEDEI